MRIKIVLKDFVFVNLKWMTYQDRAGRSNNIIFAKCSAFDQCDAKSFVIMSWIFVMR